MNAVCDKRIIITKMLWMRNFCTNREIWYTFNKLGRYYSTEMDTGSISSAPSEWKSESSNKAWTCERRNTNADFVGNIMKMKSNRLKPKKFHPKIQSNCKIWYKNWIWNDWKAVCILAQWFLLMLNFFNRIFVHFSFSFFLLFFFFFFDKDFCALHLSAM